MIKKNIKTPLVFKIGLVLVCLFLVSSYMTGGLYARYTTTSSGLDSAKVAKFKVDSGVVSSDLYVNLNFYDPALVRDEKEFTVASSSDVAVKYDVVVTMPSGMDYSWLEVTLQSGEETLVATSSGNVFSFSDVGLISVGDRSEYEYTLAFNIVEERQGNPQGVANIQGVATLSIRAEQVD